jgi:hypothetical protein
MSRRGAVPGAGIRTWGGRTAAVDGLKPSPLRSASAGLLQRTWSLRTERAVNGAARSASGFGTRIHVHEESPRPSR